MSDYGQFKLGGVTYPVGTSPFVGALTKLDPILAAAIAFYKAMLETHLGAYFAAMVTATGAPNLSANIVAETVSYDPSPYLQESQYKFPLLAMYRTEEDVEDHTVNWYKAAAKYTFLYVLPPLDAARANQILPILRGVRSVIVDRTIQGYDPAYLSGVEVWAAPGVMSIGVKTVRYGTMPDAKGDLIFPALELTIACEEREQNNPGLDSFAGIDGTVDVSNGTPEEDVTVTEFSWEAV